MPLIWPARTQTPACCLTTFSDALAGHLQTRLNRLVSNEPRLAERIDVYSLAAIAQRLLQDAHCARCRWPTGQPLTICYEEASRAVDGHKFSQHFLLTEWEQVKRTSLYR